MQFGFRQKATDKGGKKAGKKVVKKTKGRTLLAAGSDDFEELAQQPTTWEDAFRIPQSTNNPFYTDVGRLDGNPVDQQPQ